MTKRTRTYLKGRYETGDTPTQTDYGDFIDSFLILGTSAADPGNDQYFGKLTVTSALSVAGTMSAQTVKVSGTMSAQTINASSASFTGTVSAADFSVDTLSLVTLNASAASITANVSARTITASAATFTGIVSASSFQSFNVVASGATFTGAVSASGGFYTLLSADTINLTNPALSKIENDYLCIVDTTTAQTLVSANVWQDITYNTNAQLDGWSHTAGSAAFICNTSGKYLIVSEFGYEKTGGGASSIKTRIASNGASIATTTAAVEIATNNRSLHLSNSMMVDIPLSASVRSQFLSPLTTVQLAGVTPGEPIAKITIMRIN